jgi:hypothetical protein
MPVYIRIEYDEPIDVKRTVFRWLSIRKAKIPEIISLLEKTSSKTKLPRPCICIGVFHEGKSLKFYRPLKGTLYSDRFYKCYDDVMKFVTGFKSK